jgi:hypothetical protein
MPPKSRVQQRAAGAALAAKRSGKAPPGKGAAASMAKSMNTQQLREFATSPSDGKLPMRMRPKKQGRMVNE